MFYIPDIYAPTISFLLNIYSIYLISWLILILFKKKYCIKNDNNVNEYNLIPTQQEIELYRLL